jgi:hypothetical protein
MATRYFEAKSRFGVGHVVAGVLVSALAVGAITFEYLQARAIHVATAKAWDIQGPPCPTLTEAELAARTSRPAAARASGPTRSASSPAPRRSPWS